MDYQIEKKGPMTVDRRSSAGFRIDNPGAEIPKFWEEFFKKRLAEEGQRRCWAIMF